MNNTCPSCGAVNAEAMRFCNKCGKPFGGAAKPEQLAKVKLKDNKWRVVNTWAYLIVGANGRDELLAETIKRTLKFVAAPNLLIGHRSVSLSGITSWFSGSRRQLVIENQKLMGYHFFVSIEDYGKQLNVSWYLMVKNNWITKLVQLAGTSPWVWIFLFWLIPFAKIYYAKLGLAVPELMNMFDLEELTAYTTTAHHAVLDAVQNLMKSMDLDFSKVDTKSRGFLNIV